MTELPTSWPAVTGYALLLAFMAWSGWHQNRRAKVTAAAVDEVREQVSNSHSTNLREELDERHVELLASTSKQHIEMLRELSELRIESVRELSGIRETLTEVDERTARIGREVIADRKTMYDAINRADRAIAKHHPED